MLVFVAIPDVFRIQGMQSLLRCWLKTNFDSDRLRINRPHNATGV